MIKFAFKNQEVDIKINLPERKENYGIISNVMASIIGLNVCEEVTATVEEPKVITNTAPKVYDSPRKDLVFFKCKECGEIGCKLIDLDNIDNELPECRHCKEPIFINPSDLVKGRYECACGQKGSFLMQPDVNCVKCKSCFLPLFMVEQPDGTYCGKDY